MGCSGAARFFAVPKSRWLGNSLH